MSDASDELLRRGYQARRENRPSDARRDFLEAVDLCRKDEDRLELAHALTGLGQMERDLSHGMLAARHYEEAVAIFRAEGGALRLAHTVRHLGDIYCEEGRFELAEPCFEEALALYRADERTPPLDLANAIRGFAILKGSTGKTGEARLLWVEARDLYAVLKVQEGVVECDERLVLLTSESG